MRIRSIKPEFWRSDDITALSREHRLLFVGLWSYVDDNGVGIDDYRQIAADLFALEDDQKEVRDYVREGLATLSRGLLIARYAVDGKRYFYVTGWPRHQRIDKPGKQRYPLPPSDWEPPTSENVPSDDPFATPSRDSRETVAPGTGEQGNRGVTTSRSATAKRTRETGVADFDAFYALYPKKRARGSALIAWRKMLRKGATVEHVMAGLRAQIAFWHSTNQDLQYVPYPASWLNAESYDDDFGPVRLTVVRDIAASATPAAGLAELREQGDAQVAANLIGELWIAPPQPPGDRTPPQQYDRDQRVEWIDAHADAILAALDHRETG